MIQSDPAASHWTSVFLRWAESFLNLIVDASLQRMFNAQAFTAVEPLVRGTLRRDGSAGKPFAKDIVSHRMDAKNTYNVVMRAWPWSGRLYGALQNAPRPEVMSGGEQPPRPPSEWCNDDYSHHGQFDVGICLDNTHHGLFDVGLFDDKGMLAPGL